MKQNEKRDEKTYNSRKLMLQNPIFTGKMIWLMIIRKAKLVF